MLEQRPTCIGNGPNRSIRLFLSQHRTETGTGSICLQNKSTRKVLERQHRRTGQQLLQFCKCSLTLGSPDEVNSSWLVRATALCKPREIVGGQTEAGTSAAISRQLGQGRIARLATSQGLSSLPLPLQCVPGRRLIVVQTCTT